MPGRKIKKVYVGFDAGEWSARCALPVDAEVLTVDAEYDYGNNTRLTLEVLCDKYSKVANRTIYAAVGGWDVPHDDLIHIGSRPSPSGHYIHFFISPPEE